VPRFVSDLHLDPDEPARTAAFVRWLAAAAAEGDDIYVLGDLTEVWVGDDDDAPFARALAATLAQATKSCRVFLMHGNRDFLIDRAFARATGVEIIGDEHTIDTPLGRTLLCHGDALCTEDRAYMALRATLRSAVWQRDFLTQSLAARREFVKGLRAGSRAANANKAENIMDVTPAAVVETLRRHDAALLVHGHTHRPGCHPVALEGTTRCRYVLGDWNRCGWSLRLDAAGATLECFSLRE
jgi:UDP-2,3-diacylglucosamine hydrolase